jgi:hypothetical protein
MGDYNQHVRLLSSEPFGCLRLQSLLGPREPTLLWNHYTHYTQNSDFIDLRSTGQPSGGCA